MENIFHPALARMVENGSCEVAGRRTRTTSHGEFIEGQTLSRQLKIGRLEEHEVLAIGRDVPPQSRKSGRNASFTATSSRQTSCFGIPAAQFSSTACPQDNPPRQQPCRP